MKGAGAVSLSQLSNVSPNKRACTKCSRSFSLPSLRVVLEYADISAYTLGFQFSRLSSVNFGDYEFVSSYAELFPPCVCFRFQVLAPTVALQNGFLCRSVFMRDQCYASSYRRTGLFSIRQAS